MPIENNTELSLPFAEPKKRGLIRLVSGMFWLAPLDSLPLTGLISFAFAAGGLGSLLKKNFTGGLSSLVIAGGLGALAYWQWMLLEKNGTSPFKKFFNMQVLKYDDKIKGYRKCTPVEYIARDILAMIYFPISFMVMSIPAMLGGALAGGARSSALGGHDKYDNAIVRDYKDRQVQAAAAAGAAAGMAASLSLIQKFPWILALHDSVMKTMVVTVTSEQAKYFADGGVLQTGAAIKPFSQAA